MHIRNLSRTSTLTAGSTAGHSFILFRGEFISGIYLSATQTSSAHVAGESMTVRVAITNVPLAGNAAAIAAAITNSGQILIGADAAAIFPLDSNGMFIPLNYPVQMDGRQLSVQLINGSADTTLVSTFLVSQLPKA